MDDIHSLLDRGYRYAVSLTGDPVAAEDVLQDAWAAVLQANGPREAPYLFRAIRSRWIDRHRRSQVIPMDPTDDPIVAVGPEAHRLVEADAVWEGLLTLRPEEREALYLHVVEGYSAREVSERIDKPRNTVLSLIHRGRAKFKEWFHRSEKEVIG